MIVRSICIGLVGSISMAVSRQNYVILWIRINESILFRHPICRKGYVAQIILSYSVVLEVPRMEGWNHSYMIIQMGWWDDMAFTPKPSACMKGFTVSNCGVLIVKETAMFRHYLTKKNVSCDQTISYYEQRLSHWIISPNLLGFASISADICGKKMQLQRSRHNWIPVQASPNPFSCEHKEPNWDLLKGEAGGLRNIQVLASDSHRSLMHRRKKVHL